MAAAKAWEVEATLAERRASKSRALDKLDAAITLEFERETRLEWTDRAE
ncbi:hypothetical protein PMI04_013150 [Sphingobium sp. AP49]|nr:hypothetical protein [Sphingobium sp. AP49]WHO37514.1 hypothetical protein PMI04_013150 [Sphingobium sp. AP49]